MQISSELTSNKAAQKLFEIFDDNIRFVGGCVRDSLIDKPIKDIDMATKILPEEIIKKCDSYNIRTIPTGIKHGTVTALIDGFNIEITTLRRDTSCDGRHADVEFTDDWQQDASRRDFTVNALYADKNGKIYDYFNGFEDLKNRVIKFVGNPQDRCREDILRILRFFRFNAYYGKKIDQQSLSACKEYANQIPNLSAERINTEMTKLISAPCPIDILNLMQQENILEFISPVKLNISLLEKLLKGYAESDFIIRLAALLKDTQNHQKLAIKWKLSNKQKAFLNNVLSDDLNPKNINEKIIKKLIIDYSKEYISSSLILKHAQTGDNKYKELLTFSQKWQEPIFPLNGNDLIKKGITDGKQIGSTLNKAKQYWHESDYSTSKEDLLKYLKL